MAAAAILNSETVTPGSLVTRLVGYHTVIVKDASSMVSRRSKIAKLTDNRVPLGGRVSHYH